MIFHEFSRFFSGFWGWWWLVQLFVLNRTYIFRIFGRKNDFIEVQMKKSQKNSFFSIPKLQSEIWPTSDPHPSPKIFQIFVANFINFHLSYSKWKFSKEDFFKQLLTDSCQKLIFLAIFVEIWPQDKNFCYFFAPYDQ